MNAHQTASLISYLGAFRSSSTSWRHSEDREGVVPVSREFSSARDVADHMGKIKSQILKVAPLLSGPDMAAIIVGLARMNFDWSKVFGSSKVNPLSTRLEKLLSTSSGRNSRNSDSDSVEASAHGSVSFVSTNAQSKKTKQKRLDTIVPKNLVTSSGDLA